MWRELSAQTGDIIGLVQAGLTHMAKDMAELAKFVGWMPNAKKNDVDSRLLSHKELADIIPEAQRDWAGVIFTASDMRAEPMHAVPTLARLAVQEAVTIIEGCAARRIERTAEKSPPL